MLHSRKITPLVASDYDIYSMCFTVTIISHFICTRVHLYTIVLCRDGAIIDMCPYLLLVAIHVACHWLGIHNL